MSDYDFHTLSDYEFETLVRDLLDRDWSLHLESFKRGSDWGIDARHVSPSGHMTVVQCKHWLSSNVKALVRFLESEERPKVDQIGADRYVLATSLPLSPADKAKIMQALGPSCHTPADVLGRAELNALLEEHPDIHRRHFKLWLSSVDVLEAMIQRDGLNLTSIVVESLKEKTKLFVETRPYVEAMDVLERLHFCLITGIPGIGKTTVAEMLFLDLVLNGDYEPTVISGDIREGISFYSPKRKQVFLYDDFLGQTALQEKLGKNEDSRLSQFIELISRSPHHRFIMTTREYILNQAAATYERLASWALNRYVVQMNDFTRRDKARILYNHLYFAGLPHTYLDAFVEDEFYADVIDHENFNPRTVETMTLKALQLEVDPKFYGQTFLENLENPLRIWSHAFENQISTPSQHLLETLASFPTEVSVEALDELVGRTSGQSNTIERAVRELDGSFVLSNISGSHSVVRFHNPSVRDFLRHWLLAHPKELNRMIDQARYMEQVLVLAHLCYVELTSDQIPAASLADAAIRCRGRYICGVSGAFADPNWRWRDEPAQPLPQICFIVRVLQTRQEEESWRYLRSILDELAVELRSETTEVFDLLDFLEQISLAKQSDALLPSLLEIVVDEYLSRLVHPTLRGEGERFIETLRVLSFVYATWPQGQNGRLFREVAEAMGKCLDEAIDEYQISESGGLYWLAERIRIIAQDMNLPLPDQVRMLEYAAAKAQLPEWMPPSKIGPRRQARIWRRDEDIDDKQLSSMFAPLLQGMPD